MKRCSQCEFTFDDEQKFCDFDGTELVAVTQPQAIRVSRARSLVHSPFPLALVMIAGVLSSALLIGYYDSADQFSVNVSSKTETDSAGAALIPPVQVDTRGQAKTPPDRPRSISTQRRISTVRGAAAMPASMIKWPTEKPNLRSSRSARDPASFQLATTNTTHRKVNNSAETKNQKRLGAPELVQQRTSVARVANRKCGAGRLGCNGASNNTESMHHAKDSKIVAFLKTTGRLLKRPFTRSQRSEVGSQKTEVRGQKSEVRGQRSEVRGQRSEVRSQRSEVALTHQHFLIADPRLSAKIRG